MKNITIIILLFAAAISACTEKIDIEVDSSYTRLVVEGSITTDTGIHWLRLTRSIDYFLNEPPPAVTGAEVALKDGVEEPLALIESADRPGYYETGPGYSGIPGRTYHVEITLPEPVNDEVFYEASCTMRPVSPIDSIKVVYQDKWEAFEVQIFALEPATTDFYSFQIIRNGILITDTIDEVWISDDRFFNGNYTNGVPVYYLFPEDNPQEQILPGDTITLRMGSITKEHYNFIFELQDETFEFRNPLFSGPPANISSNVSGDAVGFFAAYSVTYSSTVYE